MVDNTNKMFSEEDGGKNKKIRVSQDAEEDDIATLQAVLMADTPDHKFRPITLQRPKVLLPLLNIPLIEYSLAWLRSNGVIEVFVVCGDSFEQVDSYIKNSQWFSVPNFTVTMIRDHHDTDSRLTIQQLLEHIDGDFLIIRGDIVSNMCLEEALKEHKEIRNKDGDAIMTMVVNLPERDMDTYEILCGYDELYTNVDLVTKQLLYYEHEEVQSSAYFHGTLPFTHNAISATTFFQDCHIYICSKEVLKILYKIGNIRPLYMDQFVKEVLKMSMNYKIFTHILRSSYTERVDKFRSYNTISQDLIQRLINTSEPDDLFRGLVVGQSCFAEHSSVVGSETTIGTSSKISNSVIGKGCTIGSNVSIENSYIWNNVIIEDNCTLSHAIICDGAVIKSGSLLEPDTLLSFQVEVGPKFHGYANLKVSLVPTPIMQEGRATRSAARTRKLDLQSGDNIYESSDTSKVDDSESGYIWACEGYEEDWRNRISHLPAEAVLHD